MALPARQQVTIWAVAALVFLVMVWAFGRVLAPFLVGGAIAYFLDPVADRLERAGLSRTLATVVITLLATLAFVVAILLIVPTLVRETTALINSAPEVFGRLQGWLTAKFPALMDQESVLRSSLSDLGNTIKAKGGELASSVLSSAMSVLNAIIFLVVVPVVAFYMLLDWDRLVARIDALLPRDHAPTVRLIASDINRALAAFVRGQVTVCLVMAAYYAVGLSLAGLNYGIAVGSLAGMLTFIPYVGSILGGLLAIGLALYQFWGDWIAIGMVAAVFAFGQFIEGNVITPKLVGKSVGLHPVWLMLALSVFGSLMGFTGMLIAVPVAAAIGVLVRFASDRYRDSRLYQGLDHPAARADLRDDP